MKKLVNMKPKNIFLISIFLFSFLSSYSQFLRSNELINAFKTNPNLNISLQAGTSFTSYGGGVSLFSNEISPYISYQFNRKFSLEIGSSFTTYHSGNMSFMSPSGNPASSSFTGISGFVTGRYQASDKLKFSGSVYRQSSMFPSVSVNPKAFEFINQGVSFGMDYQINDRISFGAGVRMMQVSNPWGLGFRQQNPYDRNFFDY
jgi:hypothetical protein